MTYPTGVPAVRAALIAYDLPPPPDAVEAEAWQALGEKLDEIKQARSIVAQTVGVLDVLGPHAGVLDGAGAGLLVGACELIADNGFHGRAADARTTRDAALARLDELPPMPPPAGPSPPAPGQV